MEDIIVGFIYTFLIVITFETIFSRILGNGYKHPVKKIVVLAIQCLAITWLLFQMYN